MLLELQLDRAKVPIEVLLYYSLCSEFAFNKKSASKMHPFKATDSTAKDTFQVP